MLNRKQAEMLFEKEAVFFGAVDGVPETRAVELLGVYAVGFVFSCKSDFGKTFNEYSARNSSVRYLYRSGFMTAVGYANVCELLQQSPTEAGPDINQSEDER